MTGLRCDAHYKYDCCTPGPSVKSPDKRNRWADNLPPAPPIKTRVNEFTAQYESWCGTWDVQASCLGTIEVGDLAGYIGDTGDVYCGGCVDYAKVNG